MQRLIASPFLHYNLVSLVFDQLMFMITMSAFEVTFGPVRPTLIFLLAGISGSIFTDVLGKQVNKLNIGSLIGTFGLYGASFFYLIVNWSALGGTAVKCRVGMMVFFTVLMGIFLSSGFKYNDAYVLLGAFFPGVLLGGILPTRVDGNYQKVARVVGISGYFIWQVVVFLVFYLA